jgi:hypothetical protein
MEKTRKKLIGGLMAATLIAIIGATVVSAQNEDGMLWGNPDVFSELTDEQKEDLQETLKQKFEEYGVEMPTRDEILDKQIEQTELKLEILNRQKELREEGYEWEDIREIIKDEFELEFPDNCLGMKFGHHHGRGFPNFNSSEESDL